MNLTSYPTDYASAYDPNNTFCFEGADPTAPTEIIFYDGNGGVLGARRYAQRERIVTSPQSFLQRMLDPHPYTLRGCQIVRATDRSVALSVGYNDGANRSPVIHFTASQGRLPNPTALGGFSQERIISAGECDEVLFKLPKGARLTAECRFEGEESGTQMCELFIGVSDIYAVIVDADEILALNPAAECFDFVVAMSGSVVGRIHYEVATAVAGSVRLAWLNTEGFISYHTFRGVPSERLVTSRSECQTQGGTQTLAVESWRECTLRSGYLSAEGVERLSGIATSPRVWRVTAEGVEPQILLSHAITTLGSGARQVELTIRSACRDFRY